MSTVSPDEIGSFLNAYAVHAEQWKQDHAEAMACRDLEQLLLMGLSLSLSIDMIDTNWRTAMLGGQIDYDSAEEAEILRHYRTWLTPAADILARIKAMEEAGYKVQWADQFRRAHSNALALFTSDPEFFNDNALVELRDAAIDAHREGRTAKFHEHGN